MMYILRSIGGIFTLLTLGLLMGALSLAAVFLVYSKGLPSTEELANYAPPTISRIYSGEGKIIDEFAQERRLFVPAEEIPLLIKRAFISAEDKNFYSHSGYDLRGIVAAAVDALRGNGLRGASTIPQQVVKNFLLSSDRTAERKIKELILSVRLENTLEKEQILELYLNEIFLGQNSYGVAAAAQSYFNKSLDQLAPEEAAYLAALPKAPSGRHPVRQKETAIFWRNNTLREMFENGYLSEPEYRHARVQPLLTVQNGDYESFRRQLPPRNHFTDEIRRQLSRDFGEGEFFSGGMTVRATLDPQLQKTAQTALQVQLEQFDRGTRRWRGTGEVIPEEQLNNWQDALGDVRVSRDIALESRWYPAVVLGVAENELRLGIEGWQPGDPEPIVPRKDIAWMRGDFFDNFDRGDVVHVRRMVEDGSGRFIRWSLRQVPQVQGAFMAMDVDTGRVLAMQGGFSYQHSVFNRATQATRQPGSAFKPFVYAAALDSGYTPATIVVDAPITINTPQGLWRPKNASNRFYGPTPLRTGIEQSRNLMTIRLAQEVGMDVVADYAERFGVYDNMNEFLSAALGSEETTLFKMVSAYAMFANGGERVQPTLVDRVQDRYGKTVYKHDQRICEDCQTASLEPGRAPTITSNRTRVMDAVTAYQLTSMMRGVVDRGTAKRTVNLDIPIAGKTGTTNDAKDVWFVGFSSNIAAGCYIGYDRPRSMGNSAGGGSMCGPVFHRFMREASRRFGGGPFDAPEDCIFIKIDRFSGARLSDGASGNNVVTECFRPGGEIMFNVIFDGGFAMGSDLPLFNQGGNTSGVKVRTATGSTAVLPDKKATFGSLSSGGLY